MKPIFITALAAISISAAGPVHAGQLEDAVDALEFDYSKLDDDDAALMKRALPSVLKQCSGIVLAIDHITAHKVRVDSETNPDWAFLPTGASEPWLKYYEFAFLVDQTGPARYPRWAGNRFSVKFSLDPVEIFAEKTVGAQACDLDGVGIAKEAHYIRREVVEAE